MKTLIIASCLFLTGCATNTAVIRIVEYRADSVLAAVSGSGVAVHQSGGENAFVKVKIEYHAERGVVTVGE